MCGIFGTSRLTEVTRGMMPILGYEMVKRGTDAWGASNGEEIVKHLGKITSSWEQPLVERWSQGIFHTRAATHGTGKDVDNAHPFEFIHEGKRVIGIHNGVIRSHDELNKKYSRDFKVDSQHIFAHIVEGKPLKEIEGYGAIAWWEGPKNKPKEMVLCLAKFNMWDLHVARLDSGEIVFCSKEDPIKDSVGMFGSGVKTMYKIEDNTKYYVVPEGEGDTLYKSIELPFGARGYTSVTPSENFSNIYSGRRTYQQSSSRSYSGMYPWNSQSKTVLEDDCFGCGKAKITPGKQLLCKGCIAEELENFRGLSKEAKQGEVINGTS